MRSSLIVFASMLTAATSSAEVSRSFEVIASNGQTAARPRQIFNFAEQINNHHRPDVFFDYVHRAFGERGLILNTSVNRADLTLENFEKFDSVFLFGNHRFFSSDIEDDLIAYVENGGGLSAMHVAAWVARNTARLTAFMGGAFRSHYAFSAEPFAQVLIQSPSSFPANLQNHQYFPFTDGENYTSDPDHPILEGLGTYASRDEPYLMNNFNTDIVLLGYRDDDRDFAEPYTWIRHQGSGRIFYHANGHNSFTFRQPNFQELMIRGTEWVSKAGSAELFESFGLPVISPDGIPQYSAVLSENGVSKDALYSGKLQTAVSRGRAPSDEQRDFFHAELGVRNTIAREGVVALTANLDDQNVSPGEKGLFLGHPQYPRLVASSLGDASDLEAGFRYADSQDFKFVSSPSGTTVFQAIVEDSAGGNQKTVIAQTTGETTTPLAIEEDQVPNVADLRFGSLHRLEPAIAGTGHVTFTAATTKLSDATASDHLLMVAEPDGSVAPWLRTGVSHDVFGAGNTLVDFLAIGPRDEETGKVAFLGLLSHAAPNRILARTSSTGELELVFLEGASLEGKEVSFPTIPPLILHASGREIAQVVWDEQDAILSAPHDGDPEIILAIGDIISVDDANWQVSELDFSGLTASESHVVIPATLTSSLAPDENRRALLVRNPSGVRVIALEGWPLTLNGTEQTLDTMMTKGGIADSTSLNNSNQLVFRATSVEGDSAIVTVDDLNDLDRDDLPDTLEVAFGSSYDNPQSSAPPGMPVLSRDDSGAVRLTYWHYLGNEADFRYEAQTSNDLVFWESLPMNFIEAPDQTGVAPNYQRRIFDEPLEGEKRFIRFLIR